MKKIKSLLLIGIAFAVFACNDFLDVNDNPNEATSSTPQAVLPNALTVTAANIVSQNDYGAWHAGYQANAGGYGGWGSTTSYQYTTNNYAGLWTAAYDNLNDYNYIEQQSRSEAFSNFNAVAKIMKAFNFQFLVDTYGDVPYTEALQGVNKLTPAYDNGEDIYQSLVKMLDSAIYKIDNAPEDVVALGSTDVMFRGTMANWRAFANTLKLRLLIRASRNVNANTPAWVTAAFGTFGATPVFLTTDAIVNPGYVATSGKQNPMWETYHSNSAGTAAGTGRSRIPTYYALTFYDGFKINDTWRANKVYRSGITVPANQLGFEDIDVEEAPSGAPAWYIGTGTGTDATSTTGILKGRAMGQPIMLAAESYFLQAEAYLRGFLAGSDLAAFNNGIVASFTYLYKDATNTVTGTPAADAVAYQEDNSGTRPNDANRLVNYDLATTEAQKQEAIITQKWIALNFINSAEAWNEFRRTAYPVSTGSTPETNFASYASKADERADRLPARVLYPASEYQVNAANAKEATIYKTIFWDVD